MAKFKKYAEAEEYPRPVEAWEFSDGRLIKSQQEAREAQQFQDFREWYEQSSFSASVSFREFQLWLERGTNRQTLLDFLSGMED